MFQHTPTLRKLLRLGLTRSPTPKRLAWLAQSISVFELAWASASALRALDDVLYPAWRTQPIREPVFIFANARSGTTFLHRLMALDEERFASLKLYQTLFQAVSGMRAAEAVGRLDAPLGGALRRLLAAAEQRFFGRWRDIHPMGFLQHEEDEGYFIFSLVSAGLYIYYPFIDELTEVAWLDRMPERVRQRVMDDYEGSLRRLLYATGGDRQLLNKTVLVTGRMDLTLERFPDARFIYLIRHPYDSIASFLSMFHAMWGFHSPDMPPDSPPMKALARIAVDYYRRGLAVRSEVAADRYQLVRYADLVADPVGTVEKIYERFGWTLGARFRERLEAAADKAQSYRPSHQYSLAQFGIDPADIHRELADVFEEFDFAR